MIVIIITRFEDMVSRWMNKANTILPSTLRLPMNLQLLPSGSKNMMTTMRMRMMMRRRRRRRSTTEMIKKELLNSE